MTLVECSNPRCRRMFRDSPDTAGVCPSCGRENRWAASEATDDEEHEEHLRSVTW